MLRGRETIEPERFTFHSSRMRMKKVTSEELAQMDGDSIAAPRVVGRACRCAGLRLPRGHHEHGRGYHRVSEKRLHERTVDNGGAAPVVTSAGALIHGLRTIGARKIAVLTPYMKPLTELVVDYIEHEGFEVLDAISLEIADNLEVGARDPRAPIEISKRLNTANCDAVVLSPACRCLRWPRSSWWMTGWASRVVAAVCTTHQMLQTLGLKSSYPTLGPCSRRY
jgi:maleate isomerase